MVVARCAPAVPCSAVRSCVATGARGRLPHRPAPPAPSMLTQLMADAFAHRRLPSPARCALAKSPPPSPCSADCSSRRRWRGELSTPRREAPRNQPRPSHPQHGRVTRCLQQRAPLGHFAARASLSPASDRRPAGRSPHPPFAPRLPLRPPLPLPPSFPLLPPAPPLAVGSAACRINPSFASRAARRRRPQRSCSSICTT